MYQRFDPEICKAFLSLSFALVLLYVCIPAGRFSAVFFMEKHDLFNILYILIKFLKNHYLQSVM